MEQVTRVQAIKEVMKMHGLDRKTAAALIDETIRLTQKTERPIGLLKDTKEN